MFMFLSKDLQTMKQSPKKIPKLVEACNVALGTTLATVFGQRASFFKF